MVSLRRPPNCLNCIEKASTKRLKINDVANEIIHSSQIMFVHDEETIPTGLLIASDWHLKDRLLHLSTMRSHAPAASSPPPKKGEQRRQRRKLWRL